MRNFNFLRLAAFSLTLGFAAFLSSSCDTLNELADDMEKPDNPKDNATYVITVHEIIKYPRASELEIELPTYSGSTKCVNNNYFIHSKNISKIVPLEIKDKPGFYDLDLYLDRRGRVLWTSLSGNFKGMNVGFVIDGVFYREFVPEMLSDDSDALVRVKGPFDTATAMGLVRNAEKNYKLYNAK